MTIGYGRVGKKDPRRQKTKAASPSTMILLERGMVCNSPDYLPARDGGERCANTPGPSAKAPGFLGTEAQPPIAPQRPSARGSPSQSPLGNETIHPSINIRILCGCLRRHDTQSQKAQPPSSFFHFAFGVSAAHDGRGGPSVHEQQIKFYPHFRRPNPTVSTRSTD